MSIKRRDKADCYRGLLRNPTTGRVFRANATTARRTDLERVLTTDDKPIVEASAVAEEVVTAEVEAAVEQATDEAAVALDDLVAQARKLTDKDALKVLGGQIGVKLTQNMNIETMQERIATQAELIRDAGE